MAKFTFGYLVFTGGGNENPPWKALGDRPFPLLQEISPRYPSLTSPSKRRLSRIIPPFSFTRPDALAEPFACRDHGGTGLYCQQQRQRDHPASGRHSPNRLAHPTGAQDIPRGDAAPGGRAGLRNVPDCRPRGPRDGCRWYPANVDFSTRSQQRWRRSGRGSRGRGRGWGLEVWPWCGRRRGPLLLPVDFCLAFSRGVFLCMKYVTCCLVL